MGKIGLLELVILGVIASMFIAFLIYLILRIANSKRK
jgi:preprotein translocase subunit SecD